jgi:hypothetical protein
MGQELRDVLALADLEEADAASSAGDDPDPLGFRWGIPLPPG